MQLGVRSHGMEWNGTNMRYHSVFEFTEWHPFCLSLHNGLEPWVMKFMFQESWGEVSSIMGFDAMCHGVLFHMSCCQMSCVTRSCIRCHGVRSQCHAVMCQLSGIMGSYFRCHLSKAVGAPPLCTCPSTVTLVSCCSLSTTTWEMAVLPHCQCFLL